VLFGESEISDYRPALTKKNVSQFKITVQESFLGYLQEPAHDVPRQPQNLPFRQLTPAFEQSRKIALVAVLRDDVAVALFPDHIVTFEDVGVSELAESLDFAIEHFPAGRIAHAFHVDGLNRHCIVCIEDGILVRPLVPL
jgi:hypothetical protein